MQLMRASIKINKISSKSLDNMSNEEVQTISSESLNERQSHEIDNSIKYNEISKRINELTQIVQNLCTLNEETSTNTNRIKAIEEENIELKHKMNEILCKLEERKPEVKEEIHAKKELTIEESYATNIPEQQKAEKQNKTKEKQFDFSTSVTEIVASPIKKETKEVGISSDELNKEVQTIKEIDRTQLIVTEISKLLSNENEEEDKQILKDIEELQKGISKLKNSIKSIK